MAAGFPQPDGLNGAGRRPTAGSHVPAAGHLPSPHKGWPMSDRTMTEAGIARGAAVIGSDDRTLRAVLQVETAGSGFMADGRPKILFERHVFHRLTGGQYDLVSPSVSNPKAGGYNEDSYRKLYI